MLKYNFLLLELILDLPPLIRLVGVFVVDWRGLGIGGIAIFEGVLLLVLLLAFGQLLPDVMTR